MAYAYSNIIITDELTVGPAGAILDSTKGYLISGDGTKSVVVPVGADGTFLTADSSTSNGLAWEPASGLVVAGDGLSYTGNVLNVGGSATIIAATDTLDVNSNATAGQPLLSSGTVGTAAAYGPLDLASASSITGTLPTTRGGTGSTTFAANNIIVSDGSGTALIASGINPANLPATYLNTTTNATPATVVSIPTVANSAVTVTLNSLGKSAAEAANFRVRITFDVSAGGVVTLVGTDLVYVPVNTTWLAGASISGTNIVVQVTGAAATTINWASVVEVLTVTL